MNASELNDLLVQLNFCNSDYTHADYDTFENSIKAIEQLRKERDEARRTVCKMSIQLGGVFRRVGGKTVEVTTPEGCAEIMRWDCFKEETQ